MLLTRRLLIPVVVPMLLALAGCAGEAPADREGGNQADNSASTTTGSQDEAVSGDVIIDGSSTVWPITTAVAEEFRADYPDVNVSVGLSGTGGGFEKFCNGETDINDASRPIKDEEAAACAANGIEYTEFLLAMDGLTVVVNPANDWAQCLTQQQLAQLFGSTSAAQTWADIDPAWPAEPIVFFVPDTDSGTYDYMVEVMKKTDEGVTEIRTGDTVSNSSDDNVLVTGVANEQYAVGFFGYAYYVEAGDSIRAVAIQDSEGQCVLPSDQTVQDGSYNPLSRPLFIYANNARLREAPQVAEFVRFYLSGGAEAVMADVGYSLPPEGAYEEDLARLDRVLGE